jgi:hypothetical protein
VSALKRALILGFTFGFGAIWVLAFFLPSEIGGGIDRHGMYAADLVGTRLYYTTASRAIPKSLAEAAQGSFIAMMDLTDTSVRSEMFSLSPFRGVDYFGASRPIVFETGSGFRALYIGFGHDGKRRICTAVSADGTNWTPRDTAVFSPPPSASPDGPAWYTAWREGERYLLAYSAQVRGRQILRYAESADLIEWTDHGEYLSLPEPESIAAITHLSDGTLIVVSRVGSGTAALSVGSRDGTSLTNRREASLSAGAFASEIADVRSEPAERGVRLVVTGGRLPDGRLQTGVLEGETLETAAPVANSQGDGSAAALSAQAVNTRFGDLARSAADFVPIVSSLAFGTGLISVIGLHGRRVAKGGANRWYSVVTLTALAAMLTVQIGYRSNRESELWSNLNEMLFMNVQFPLGATMFGLLAAYLVSAAYRAFRVRTFDAAVLTAMAALVVITQVPTGQFLGGMFGEGGRAMGANVDSVLTEARTWSLLVVNNAVQTAVGFGAFVGAIAMALRVWLSLDRTSFE